mgnify:CR=1 FL=1
MSNVLSVEEKNEVITLQSYLARSLTETHNEMTVIDWDNDTKYMLRIKKITTAWLACESYMRCKEDFSNLDLSPRKMKMYCVLAKKYLKECEVDLLLNIMEKQ